MDLIRPLDHIAQGYRFVLVIVDYATWYPEAVPLRSISAKSVAQALFQLISHIGIPKEILMDQVTSFMSCTLRNLYRVLEITSICTSMYHPQTDGLVKRFNKTMLRKFVHEDSRNWDKWLDPLLFERQQHLYNRGTRLRQFAPGDQGLLTDSLIYRIQGEIGLLHSVWLLPI